MRRRTFFGVILGVVASIYVPSRPWVIDYGQSQTYVWRGGMGEWDDPNNWQPYGVPGDGDEAFVYNGSIHIDGQATINTLWMGGDGNAGDAYLVRWPRG